MKSVNKLFDKFDKNVFFPIVNLIKINIESIKPLGKSSILFEINFKIFI